MKKMIVVPGRAVLALSAAGMIAATGPAAAQEGRPYVSLSEMDADADGVVTVAEYVANGGVADGAQRRAEFAAQIDEDGNGVISEQEFDHHIERMRSRRSE